VKRVRWLGTETLPMRKPRRADSGAFTNPLQSVTGESPIEQSGPMAKFDSPYDRIRKLPKQFKPLRAYEEERRRGVAHTPEYDEQMRVLKEEFQRWLLGE
jgi:hypothetical protein